MIIEVIKIIKILYVPLDERPCNYLYPQYISKTRKDIELIVPHKELLGNKKEPGDVNKIWEFVLEESVNADIMVLSIEMLIYGGLLPSRLHNLSKEEGLKRINNFITLKELNPLTPIFGFNLIMRTPRYNSSDEEPDYYEEYGEKIFYRAYLMDKKSRVGLNVDEEKMLNKICNIIPQEYLKDYENRRKFNLLINKSILELVEKDIIDFLSIPQDDSSVYGYTAKDQKVIYRNILKKNIQNDVMIYPGADEVGSTLIARALNYLLDRSPKVYPFYSSTKGPLIIPLYEDRPLNESLKAHILASGCQWINSPEDADFILAINSPGEIMEEATYQDNKDISYNSFRQLNFFVDQIYRFVNQNKPVVVADSAFANGGDLELIRYLDEYNVLERLVSYKGWNTNCNTLGTSIAAGVFGLEKQNQLYMRKNLLYHLLEDGLYQAKIRKVVTDDVLPSLGGNYFQLNGQDEKVSKEVKLRLKQLYEKIIKKSFKNISINNLKIYFPWHRMFEIGIDFEISKNI